MKQNILDKYKSVFVRLPFIFISSFASSQGCFLYILYIWKSIGQLQNTNTNVTGQWLNWIARLFTKIVVWIFPEWIIASAVWALSCHNGPCSKCICVCVWLHWTRGKWHRVSRKYGRTKKQEILCHTLHDQRMQMWGMHHNPPFLVTFPSKSFHNTRVPCRVQDPSPGRLVSITNHI